MMITNNQMDESSKPLAKIHGKHWLEQPADLYIPEKPLEVLLETFEGPLDLLLYLIKKQKLDIVNLPIATITEQYLAFVEQSLAADMEVAAEYLIMAAKLAEIKSRMLLPKAIPDEDEVDPRAELAKRLQEYQQYKRAAEQLAALPQLEQDYFQAHGFMPEHFQPIVEQASIELSDLLTSLKQVLSKSAAFEHHHVQKEALTTQQKIQFICDKLATVEAGSWLPLTALFVASEGKLGVVVTFLALLELLKSGQVQCQREQLGFQVAIAH